MSDWGDYFKSKGYIVIETEKGFMTAILHKDVCMVDNFYVRPEYRGTRVALRLTEKVISEAERAGCIHFTAEVYKSDPLYKYIVRLHAHFGMSVIEDTPYKTITSKRINLHVRPEIAVL